MTKVALGGGTEDISQLPISVYPSPFDNRLEINLQKLPYGTITSTEITDALGRTVYTSNNPLAMISIDTKKWSNGLYVLKLHAKDGKDYTRKLIKD